MTASATATSKLPMTERVAALRLQLVASEMSARVGARIRQRREELGIQTQRELASLIPIDSVTNQTINKWEKGVHEPGPQYKALLAKALQVDVAYFIAEEPKGETPDLSNPSGTSDDGLADRLKALEQRVSDQLAEHAQRVEGLLDRQSRVLERIEAAIDREDEAAARRDAESARLLAEAVQQALRALEDDAQETG